ncbi:hypothetical protein [Streptomyces sp. NPDC053069]|uniref:nSTAND1 domain-containing NTPase n=1 Tax=Streptomyces sp. NPDC053069 TaxID=3365695 RepID=UPI0037CF4703
MTELLGLFEERLERRAFLDALCATTGPAGSLLVVVAVRADFYGHCLAHEGLLRAVREGQLALGPMDRDELPPHGGVWLSQACSPWGRG